ncbi:MAG TPA: hypothetical protein VKA30_10710 [Actinomycetota bacterium]|nr:hypothetical protein [Actinomycetota bacterium]
MEKRKLFVLGGSLAAVMLFAAACGGSDTSGSSASPATAAAATADSKAAALRSDLNRMLEEHVYLAAAATGAALDGRAEEFDAAAAALGANSDDIINTFGSVYPDAKATFSDAWKGHIGFVVDYTTGLATGDQGKADQAVADLQGYASSFGAFLAETVKTLPGADAVSSLVLHHVLTLKAVIDDQKAGDQAKAYADLKAAAAHMRMLGDPLASAIVADNPQAFVEA